MMFDNVVSNFPLRSLSSTQWSLMVWEWRSIFDTAVQTNDNTNVCTDSEQIYKYIEASYTCISARRLLILLVFLLRSEDSTTVAADQWIKIITRLIIYSSNLFSTTELLRDNWYCMRNNYTWMQWAISTYQKCQ